MPRAMLTEASNYDELYRSFRWDIPARFNIATACCDRHADGSGKLALIYLDEAGDREPVTEIQYPIAQAEESIDG